MVRTAGRFMTLEHKGRKLYFDLACPVGTTYFLNSRYIKLVAHKERTRCGARSCPPGT